MRDMQKADKFSLSKLVSKIGEGSFVIPDFQRDFEWAPADVCDLIRSIFADYYIGTLLLWRGKEQHFDTLSCEPIFGSVATGKPDYIVLDGQQRLTALHFACFSPDLPFPNRKTACFFYVDMKSFLDGELDEAFHYTFATVWRDSLKTNPELQYKGHILPLWTLGGDAWAITEWIQGYTAYWQQQHEEAVEQGNEKAAEQAAEFAGRKDELRSSLQAVTRDYEVTYIELDKDLALEKVCEIFTKINSTGVTLDIFDLLNAMLRPKEIKLKKLWHDCEERLNFADFGKMNVHVLQTISILVQAYCSPKYLYYLIPNTKKPTRSPEGKKGEVVLIPTAEEFVKQWHGAADAVENAINRLKSPRGYGAVTPPFIPYPSIIPALAAAREEIRRGRSSESPKNSHKIDYWYWASIFTNRYSSAVESTSARDFLDLKRWFADDSAQPLLIEEFAESFRNLDLRFESRKSAAIYRAVFNMLVIKGAKDFLTLETPEHDKLDDHHIVPASWGKKNNVAQIEVLPENRTVT